MSDPSLRTSHALKLLSSLERMRCNKFICDFIIKAGAKEFPVHSAVVAGSSKYFEGMFESGMKEVQIGVIDLQGVTEEAAEVCIEFMYSANPRLKMEHIDDILKASNLLLLDDLHKLCFDFLEMNISPQTCLDVRNIAKNYDHAALVEKSEEIIILNFGQVIGCVTSLKLKRSDIMRYIPYLKYDVLWHAVVTWSQAHKNDFTKICEDIMFDKYPLNFLCQIILCEPLVQNEELIKRQVIKAIFADIPKLRKHLDTINCVDLRNLATANDIDLCGDANVVIITFMKQNFSKLLKQEGFKEITLSDLITVFKSDDISISDELKWEATIKWVKADTKQRKKYFQELFFLLQLENYSTEFLQNMQNESLVTESSKCCTLLMKTALFKASQLSKEYKNLQRYMLDSDKEQEIVCGMNAGSMTVERTWRRIDGHEHIPTKFIHYKFEAGKAKGISYDKVEYTSLIPATLCGPLREAFLTGQVFNLVKIPGAEKGCIVLSSYLKEHIRMELEHIRRELKRTKK